MIQAPLPKPIETKAPVRAESVSSNKAPKAKKEAEASSESKEFAKELEAKVSDSEKPKKSEKSEKSEKARSENQTEAKVKTVKVSPEQALEMPSALVNQNGTVDTTSPKIFDPEVTKDVEALIQPKSVEVAVPVEGTPVQLTDAQIMELATGEVSAKEMEGELAQAMLKTPQVAQASGRAPAIDFAKAEVDPQLLNNEDFVAQKNMAAKKPVANAYGMKAVPAQQQKMALEAGLKQTQIVKDASALESAPMNSQQFILNMMNEKPTGAQVNETQAAPKVFDLSNIKTTNSNEIINQITDYVVQAKAAKEPTVTMRMNHDELGIVDITVSKVMGQNAADAVAINIGAHSIDGKNFFQQNSKELFTHMASAGINVSDMKVETPSQTAKNEFDFGSQQGRNQHGDKQFGSEQNQRRHEQERRQDLWKRFNQEAA